MRTNLWHQLPGVFGLAFLALTGCGGAAVPAAGTVSKPLELQLKADRAAVVLGDTITFTSTISNPNEVPVNLFLGQSYSGIVFVNGSALEARPQGAGWDAKNTLKHVWGAGFCGTCSYSLVVAIPAKGSVQYSAAAHVKTGDKGPYLNFGGSAEQDYLMLPLKSEGKFHMRAAHTANADMMIPADSRWLPKEKSVANGYAPDESAPNWTGTLISNDVPIEVKLARRG